ncbi:hypothetical protein BDW71DRAFT_199325 [Aspergillus fruticulosus]
MGDPANPRALRSNTTLQDAPLAAYKTFLGIRTAIFASAESRDLAFDNIPPSIGSAVFDALLEDQNIEDLMPRLRGPVHGLLPALIPNTDSLLSTVAESGWSDSWPKLIAGMELWLRGGRPNVQLVLLFNWSKRANNSVAGEVRMYERTADGNGKERFRASIFPIAQGGPAGIPVAHGEIFGVSGVFPGQNAADVWHVSLTRLQQTADRWVMAVGFVPA